MSRRRLSLFRERVLNLLPLTVLLLLFQAFINSRNYYYFDGIALGNKYYATLAILTFAIVPTLFIALFPKKGIRIALSIFIGIIYAVIFFFEKFLSLAYRTIFTDGIALNIMATNPQEARSMMDGVTLPSVLIPLGLIILALIIAGGVCYLLQRGKKYYPSWISHLYLGMCGLILILFTLAPPPVRIKSSLGITREYAFYAPMIRIINRTMVCLRNHEEIERTMKENRTKRITGITTTMGLDSLNVVFILGESSSRYYMHSYGYPLPNTPKMDSLVKSGDMVLYTDAVSPGSHTIYSVAHIQTLYAREEDKLLPLNEVYQYPTLSRVFSSAGYYSYWLSNQEAQGEFAQPVALLAATSDSVRFVNNTTHDSNITPKRDLDLISRLALPEEIQKRGYKALYEVVHLQGSHVKYEENYPKEFAKFSGKDIPKLDIWGRELPREYAEHTSFYINNLLYVDYVIGEIIHKYQEGAPTLIIYTPDHGQSIHEDPKARSFAGHSTTASGVGVPLVWYMNKQAKEKYPILWEKITKAKDLPIMTDVLANSLLSLLGIKTPYYNSQVDIFSPNYNKGRSREPGE